MAEPGEFRVWKGGTAYGRWQLDRGVLGRLEPLDLDLKYHQEITHQDLEHREAAAAAGAWFNPAWKDDEVRAWWLKTVKFLATPAAWVGDFNSFDP
jgi:hypothetical protein